MCRCVVDSGSGSMPTENMELIASRRAPGFKMTQTATMYILAEYLAARSAAGKLQLGPVSDWISGGAERRRRKNHEIDLPPT